MRCYQVSSMSNRRLLASIPSCPPNMSFAFSGCGWITPFHLGVIKSLRDAGYLTNKSVVAGSSGGSIAATIAATDACTSKAMELILKLSKDKEFNRNKDLGIRRVILEFLPSSESFKGCNNILHITVTQVSPAFVRHPIVVSDYHSNEDLAAAVSSSCYIPLWSNLALSTDFRGTRVIDGGVFSFMPPIGNVTVTPFPKLYSYIHRKKNKKASISPLLLSGDRRRYSEPKLLYWGLNPPSLRTLEDLFNYGVQSADVWVETQQRFIIPQ